MKLGLPISYFVKEYRDLPKKDRSLDDIERFRDRTVREVFYTGVVLYYVFLVFALLSIAGFIATLNPIVFIFPAICLPGPVAFYFSFRYIKKDPNRYFRRRLKYSLMGLLTDEYDEYIYGERVERNKRLPRKKFELYLRLLDIFIPVISFFLYLPFFAILLSVPQDPMRDIFLVSCLISLICWVLFAIWYGRRLFKKRYSIS